MGHIPRHGRRQGGARACPEIHTHDLNLSDSRGLTLVELMVVLVLSLLLSATVYLAYQVQHRSSLVQHQVTSIQQDIRAAMDIIAKDIRNAGYDTNPSSSSVLAIVTSSSGASSLTVQNMGGSAAYTLSGTDLLRDGQIMVSNVTSLGFTYTSGTSNDITGAIVPSQVRYIMVNITIARPDPDNPGTTIDRTLTRRVRLRNQGL